MLFQVTNHYAKPARFRSFCSPEKKKDRYLKTQPYIPHCNSKIYAFARTAWKALPLLIKSETTRATAAAVYAGMNTLRRL